MNGNTKLLIVSLVFVIGFDSLSTAPLEEGQFLRQIVDQYSPPLVISFLHSRLNDNQQMVSKIKNSLSDLNQSKHDVFDLAEKSLQLLNDQLTVMENADYFNINGTDKVKYFVEQFIMINEFYPIDFGSNGMVNVNGSTVDDILEQFKILTFDKLINQTVTLIGNYLSDLDKKRSNLNYNGLQKLSISLAMTELQALVSQLNVIKSSSNNNNYQPQSDPRKVEVDKVLRKLQTIVDFFYSQFNHLADHHPIVNTTPKPTVNYNTEKEIDLIREFQEV